MAAQLKKRRPQGRIIYFQEDNARPHMAECVKNYIEPQGWEVLPHPPYSPDLAPSDYHLFRSLSNDLRGRKFTNEDELKSYLQNFFDSKSKSFYEKGIKKLHLRWQEVVNSKGEYISSK